MDDPILRPVREYYRGKLRDHGPGAPGMDWKDQASQYLRFDRLTARIDWSVVPTILDVGCGSGELLAYLRARGLPFGDYLGIDIVPEMVDACRRRFGQASARLASMEDLLAGTERFDHVVASGTFNVKLAAADEEWREYFHRGLAQMFALCRTSIVFNVMSIDVVRRYDHLYYATLQELADLAVRRLSRGFIIDHAYPLFELTMSIQRV